VKLTKWDLDYILWGISLKALAIVMDRYPLPEIDADQPLMPGTGGLILNQEGELI
jgi:hypothetical protein